MSSSVSVYCSEFPQAYKVRHMCEATEGDTEPYTCACNATSAGCNPETSGPNEEGKRQSHKVIHERIRKGTYTFFRMAPMERNEACRL